MLRKVESGGASNHICSNRTAAPAGGFGESLKPRTLNELLACLRQPLPAGLRAYPPSHRARRQGRRARAIRPIMWKIAATAPADHPGRGRLLADQLQVTVEDRQLMVAGQRDDGARRRRPTCTAASRPGLRAHLHPGRRHEGGQRHCSSTVLLHIDLARPRAGTAHPAGCLSSTAD